MKELCILSLCLCVQAFLVTLGVCAPVRKPVLQVVVMPTNPCPYESLKVEVGAVVFPTENRLFVTDTHHCVEPLEKS